MDPNQPKHLSPWIAWSLVVLFAGISLFTTWYYYDQASSAFDDSVTFFGINVGKNKTINTSTTASTSETADWKTYTNSAYGFSFKYPKDWTASELSNWPGALLTFGINEAGYEPKDGTDMPNSIRFELFQDVATLDQQRKKIGGITTLKDLLDKYSNLADPSYTGVKSKKIGKYSGFQASAGPNSFGGGIYYFAELPNKQIVQFWLFKETNESTMDNLLSTFQFTK